MSALTTCHEDIKHILDQAICYTACSKFSWSNLRLIMLVDSVVKDSFTTAADGNLSVIPTGSQNPKQWRPFHG
jgi:hypothetical protein